MPKILPFLWHLECFIPSLLHLKMVDYMSSDFRRLNHRGKECNIQTSNVKNRHFPSFSDFFSFTIQFFASLQQQTFIWTKLPLFFPPSIHHSSLWMYLQEVKRVYRVSKRFAPPTENTQIIIIITNPEESWCIVAYKLFYSLEKMSLASLIYCIHFFFYNTHSLKLVYKIEYMIQHTWEYPFYILIEYYASCSFVTIVH